MAKNKKESYYIECEMLDLDIDYTLRPKCKYFSSFMSDMIAIKTQVIHSDTKNIKVNDIIILRIFVKPEVDYDNANPEGFGSFNKSRKRRECYVNVTNNFPERLSLILQQEKTPYFNLKCETGDFSTMNVESFSMQSSLDMWSSPD